MDKKEKAIKLVDSILQDWNTNVNHDTAACLNLKSDAYDLLYEATENAWIPEKFFIQDGLWMDRIPIFKED